MNQDTENELIKTVNRLAALTVAHEELLVAIVANLPNGKRIADDYARRSHVANENRLAQPFPDAAIENQGIARGAVLFALQEAGLLPK